MVCTTRIRRKPSKYTLDFTCRHHTLCHVGKEKRNWCSFDRRAWHESDLIVDHSSLLFFQLICILSKTIVKLFHHAWTAATWLRRGQHVILPACHRIPSSLEDMSLDWTRVSHSNRHLKWWWWFNDCLSVYIALHSSRVPYWCLYSFLAIKNPVQPSLMPKWEALHCWLYLSPLKVCFNNIQHLW